MANLSIPASWKTRIRFKAIKLTVCNALLLLTIFKGSLRSGGYHNVQTPKYLEICADRAASLPLMQNMLSTVGLEIIHLSKIGDFHNVPESLRRVRSSTCSSFLSRALHKSIKCSSAPNIPHQHLLFRLVLLGQNPTASPVGSSSFGTPNSPETIRISLVLKHIQCHLMRKQLSHALASIPLSSRPMVCLRPAASQNQAD